MSQFKAEAKWSYRTTLQLCWFCHRDTSRIADADEHRLFFAIRRFGSTTALPRIFDCKNNRKILKTFSWPPFWFPPWTWLCTVFKKNLKNDPYHFFIKRTKYFHKKTNDEPENWKFTNPIISKYLWWDVKHLNCEPDLKNEKKLRRGKDRIGKKTIYWMLLGFDSVCEIWVYRHIQCFHSSWYYWFTEKEDF